MPSGGEDHAAPPVRVWQSASRARLAELVHGAHFYSMGAGGFDKVFAFPTMIRLRQPANPNERQQVRAAQIYTTNQPVTLKQRLEGQFGRI